MLLVEQTILDQKSPFFAEIDAASFAAKNLWNAANYHVRQAFIFEGIYLDNVKIFHQMKTHEAYKALPAKVSNSILIQLHKAWIGFFASIKEWKASPEKFTDRPKLPKYKDKVKGRFLLIYDTQALGNAGIATTRRPGSLFRCPSPTPILFVVGSGLLVVENGESSKVALSKCRAPTLEDSPYLLSLIFGSG
jgi:hypothetical protein